MSLARPSSTPISVEEYLRMAEEGAFAHLERVELIHGEIAPMTPMRGPHATAIANLMDAISDQLERPRASVLSQLTLEIDPSTAVEPDVLVLRPGCRLAGQLPRPEMILLVAEVARGSYRRDRQVKAALYASVGIPEYWLLRVESRSVEIFRAPNANGSWGFTQEFTGDAMITPESLPAVSIRVDELFS